MSLQQGSNDVSTYYTKLKSIWEELAGYKPNFQCTCGGLQSVVRSYSLILFLQLVTFFP
uniref:Retrotransposon gag domain-containing protein n=1 Tax=Cajanus cajan TaxID=3821 RepID=A0A151RL77_CAJCA|nr:hypothetical protein KK1_035248 [Cajanus cajan]